MWGIIATWRMALEGVEESASALAAGSAAATSVVDAVVAVEDFPFYKSVGYGGLPTENGEVELDAAWMDGDTLAFGAVGNLVDIANPVKVAQALGRQRYNSLLVGQGAREWALSQGFAEKKMLTERAMQHYRKRCRETLDKGLSPLRRSRHRRRYRSRQKGIDERGHLHQRPVYEKTRTNWRLTDYRFRLLLRQPYRRGYRHRRGRRFNERLHQLRNRPPNGTGYDPTAGGGFGGVRTGR